LRRNLLAEQTINPEGFGVLGISAVKLFGPAQTQPKLGGLKACDDARPRIAAHQPP
jgi:hypothetical protein